MLAGGLVLLVLLGVGVFYGLRHLGSGQAADGGAAGPERRRSFVASDFKWPALMKGLNDGTMKGAAKTDEAVFILYYLKEFNGVFADPDTKVLLGSACFAQVYNAEMDARLQAVFWTKALPKAVFELASLLTGAGPTPQALREHYPVFASVLDDLAQELPAGKLDRLFLLANLPKILQARARQDALTLFNDGLYGCRHEVTRRIYANAFDLVKSYHLNPAN